MKPFAVALLLGLALAGPVRADGLGFGQSNSMGFGLDLVNPGTRFQVTTIHPGPRLAPGGSLSAPASLGVSGPLSPTYGPGTQPLPRHGSPSNAYEKLIGRSESVEQCQSLAKIRTGSIHGLVPGCGTGRN
jgi:hypothetical protein